MKKSPREVPSATYWLPKARKLKVSVTTGTNDEVVVRLELELVEIVVLELEVKEVLCELEDNVLPVDVLPVEVLPVELVPAEVLPEDVEIDEELVSEVSVEDKVELLMLEAEPVSELRVLVEVDTLLETPVVYGNREVHLSVFVDKVVVSQGQTYFVFVTRTVTSA